MNPENTLEMCEEPGWIESTARMPFIYESW